MMNGFIHGVWLLAKGKAPVAVSMDWQEMLHAGGGIGYFILLLSLIAGAFVIQQFLFLRLQNLAPVAMVEDLKKLINLRQGQRALEICHENPCFLGAVVNAGLKEVDLDYEQVEKALEETAAEQAARLYRRIEYINMIGTLTPMLGLLGTVWGMIQAFAEFAAKTDPTVSELAPGIYHALVTTLLGLGVAIPSLAAYGLLRNRADELVAEASLLSEQVFSGYKRMKLKGVRSTTIKIDRETPSEEEPTAVEM